MPAPVSDGEHVYVTFGQGQVACYDLAGSKRWQKLVLPDKVMQRGGRSMFYSSPALIGGKLIFFPAPEQRSVLWPSIQDWQRPLGPSLVTPRGPRMRYSSIRPVRVRARTASRSTR